MNYRLQMCVVGKGEAVELPNLALIVSVREISVGSAGGWKQVFEIYYLKPEEPAKKKKREAQDTQRIGSL